MCMFTGNVEVVRNTNIFCRDDNGTHMLVYQMSADIKEDMAMLLPVPASEQEDAINFINLEKYEQFFPDMEDLFYKPQLLRSRAMGGCAAGGMLKVYDVGSFIASYVPRLKDIIRLDKRFTLPYRCWNRLPKYENFGYVVFKLKPGYSRRQPMAYKFKSTHPEFLFYPTVHVHNWDVPSMAEYDHVLYFQPGGNFRTMGWEKGDAPHKEMKIDLCQGLVDPDVCVERLRVNGMIKNQDHMINDKMEVAHNECRN